MEVKQLSVQFTDSAADEVMQVTTDLQLMQIAEALTSEGEISPSLRGFLTTLLEQLVDMFGASLPSLPADPEQALRRISRDINLARIMRERGLFRMYLLTTRKIWVDPYAGVIDPQPEGQIDRSKYPDAARLPAFMLLENPDTGQPFARQEEFIGWFCAASHVARSLVFQRMATIDRLIALGFDINEAFKVVISKPYAIQETLSMIAGWDKGEMSDVDPTVARSLMNRVAPNDSNLDALVSAAEASPDDPGIKAELVEAVKPLVRQLVTEVAEHERAKDALDYVKHDILQQPEVSYAWDSETGALLVTLIRQNVRTDTGEVVSSDPITVPFVADIADAVPLEIMADLLRRLPVRNRLDK